MALAILMRGDGVTVGVAYMHTSLATCQMDAQAVRDQAPLVELKTVISSCVTPTDAKILLDEYGCKFEKMGSNGSYLYVCKRKPS